MVVLRLMIVQIVHMTGEKNVSRTKVFGGAES